MSVEQAARTIAKRSVIPAVPRYLGAIRDPFGKWTVTVWGTPGEAVQWTNTMFANMEELAKSIPAYREGQVPVTLTFDLDTFLVAFGAPEKGATDNER